MKINNQTKITIKETTEFVIVKMERYRYRHRQKKVTIVIAKKVTVMITILQVMRYFPTLHVHFYQYAINPGLIYSLFFSNSYRTKER